MLDIGDIEDIGEVIDIEFLKASLNNSFLLNEILEDMAIIITNANLTEKEKEDIQNFTKILIIDCVTKQNIQNVIKNHQDEWSQHREIYPYSDKTIRILDKLCEYINTKYTVLALHLLNEKIQSPVKIIMQRISSFSDIILPDIKNIVSDIEDIRKFKNYLQDRGTAYYSCVKLLKNIEKRRRLIEKYAKIYKINIQNDLKYILIRLERNILEKTGSNDSLMLAVPYSAKQLAQARLEFGVDVVEQFEEVKLPPDHHEDQRILQ